MDKAKALFEIVTLITLMVIIAANPLAITSFILSVLLVIYTTYERAT